MGARKRLKEVVVRVDEARQDDMAAGVERPVDLRFDSSQRHQFHDASALDDNPPFRSVGENGERGLDPKAHGMVFHTIRLGRP